MIKIANVKTLILFISLLIIGGIIGCRKEAPSPQEKVNLRDTPIKVGITIYRACWDEWGRAKWNCHR